MNYKQKWNDDLQKLAEEFFSKLKKTFGIGYSSENLENKVTELFPEFGTRKPFFEFLDNNYSLNIRTDYESETIYGIIHRLYKRRIFEYFEKNGINDGFETDFELFKMYMSKPEQQLKDHILKALQQGDLFLVNNEYICIKWAPAILATDVIIKKDGKGFKIISAYPGCYECNRNSLGVYYPSIEETGDRNSITIGETSYEYFDSFLPFDRSGFDDDLEDEPVYCLYAFALAANLDFKTYLKEKKLTYSYIDNDGVDSLEPFRVIKTKFKELIEFKHLGKKFYMFKWNGFPDVNDSDESMFDCNIPVFIPASILPKGTELFADDEIELQIFMCAHQAVYTNPAEPKLEELKSEMIEVLAGTTIKSRAQIKQERIDLQYEFPEKKKETLEIKKKPAEYMIRIFNDIKDYDEQVMDQCKEFFEKFGDYPNVIVSNPKTFDKWMDSIEENISDNIASDKDYPESDEPSLFDDLIKKTAICEFVPDDTGKGTVFKTPDYELHIIENEEYEEGIYEIFNGYSTQLEKNSFLYPLVDAEATGKRIHELMIERGFEPHDIQKVMGGLSHTSVYNWFNGKSLPRIDFFVVLSNLFNVPLDELIVVQHQKRDKVK